MTVDTEDLVISVKDLSGNVDETFLELGRALRELHEREPQQFSDIVTKSGLGRRKAYYLVDISRAFDPLEVSRAKLKEVGWTKLAMIAKRVTQENFEKLLNLAERNNVKELDRLARGYKPLGDSHCVMMYFSPTQYEVLEQALVRHGAKKARGGRGLADKEDALLKIVRKAMARGT
jgi:hypothetical protein